MQLETLKPDDEIQISDHSPTGSTEKIEGTTAEQNVSALSSIHGDSVMGTPHESRVGTPLQTPAQSRPASSKPRESTVKEEQQKESLPETVKEPLSDNQKDSLKSESVEKRPKAAILEDKLKDKPKTDVKREKTDKTKDKVCIINCAMKYEIGNVKFYDEGTYAKLKFVF